eukprot:Nk52_evm31s239 gene=Nk52_evmTU31s239
MSKSILFLGVFVAAAVCMTVAAEPFTYTKWEPEKFVADFRAHRHFIPESYMDIFQLTKFHGYQLDSYEVITKDGFKLKAFNMPNGRTKCPQGKKEAILLGHGLLDAADTWLQDQPHQSLGYILADACYDVWFTNNRGNFHSQGHKWLKKSDPRYYQHSFDEYGRYDMPTVVDFILKKRDLKALKGYVGHSQGCTQTLIAQGYWRPDMARKINQMFHLAPAIITNNLRIPFIHQIANAADSPLGQFALTHGPLQKLLNPFLPRGLTVNHNKMVDAICDNVIGKNACKDVIVPVLYVFGGQHFNGSNIMSYMNHFPSGTTAQNMLHFAQMTTKDMQPGKFAQFDYGTPELNQKHWGHPKVKEYNAANLRIPTTVYHGSTDTLAAEEDIALYKKMVEPCVKAKTCDITFHDRKGFGHLDFVWGTAAAPSVYSDIVKRLKETKMTVEKRHIAPIDGTIEGKYSF